MSLIFKNKDSAVDFDIYPASKDLTPPKKKRITETVPFMNGEWDFSKIGGKQYYESRICKYEFDIIGNTKEEMNAAARAVINWLTVDCEGESLIDTDLSGFAFTVINADASFAEEDLQGLLTIEFICEPFMVAHNDTKKMTRVGEPIEMILKNRGCEPAVATFIGKSDMILEINGTTYETAGNVTYYYDFVTLPMGETVVKATAVSDPQNARFVWDEVSL
jgi:hypothetical protein